MCNVSDSAVDTNPATLRVEILLVVPSQSLASSDVRAGQACGEDRLKVRIFNSCDDAMGYMERKQHRARQRHHRSNAAGSLPNTIKNHADVATIESNGSVKPNRRMRRAAAVLRANTTEGQATHTEQREHCDGRKEGASTAVGGIRIHYVVLFARVDTTLPSPPSTSPLYPLHLTRGYRIYMGSASHSLCAVSVIGRYMPREVVDTMLVKCGVVLPDIDTCCDSDDMRRSVSIQMGPHSFVEFISIDTSSSSGTEHDTTCADGTVLLWNLKVVITSGRSGKVPHLICARGRYCSLTVSNCQIDEASTSQWPGTGSFAVTAISAVSSSSLSLLDCRISGGSGSTLRSAVYVGSKAHCHAKQCQFTQLQDSGFSICSGGDLWICHCDISHCGKSAVYANGASVVRTMCCKFSGNGGCGVELFLCTTGNIDCKLKWIDLSAELSSMGAAVVNCEICDNACGGILTSGSNCTVTNSNISRNRLANVTGLDGSLLRLQHSVIVGSGRSGVFLKGPHTVGTCVGCSFMNNDLHDVECCENASFEEIENDLSYSQTA